MDQLLSHATVSGKAATVSYQMVLHRPVEPAGLIRWDEKAGLQRDAISSR